MALIRLASKLRSRTEEGMPAQCYTFSFLTPRLVPGKHNVKCDRTSNRIKHGYELCVGTPPSEDKVLSTDLKHCDKFYCIVGCPFMTSFTESTFNVSYILQN